MFEEIEIKLKKKNKILFSRDSECLQSFIQLICKQKHRTLVLWAFECVEKTLLLFEKDYPDEQRPRIAFEMCQKWAQGEVKMNLAKKAILECHSACKEIESDYHQTLCHAIGQGLSTVHVETHAIGLPIYELTAIVLKNRENYQNQVIEKIKEYEESLLEWQNKIDTVDYQWADFLLKEAPNKELLLWQKQKNK